METSLVEFFFLKAKNMGVWLQEMEFDGQLAIEVEGGRKVGKVERWIAEGAVALR